MGAWTIAGFRFLLPRVGQISICVPTSRLMKSRASALGSPPSPWAGGGGGVGGDVEFSRGPPAVARHGGEQALAPQRHALDADARDHGLAAQEERGLERLEFQFVLTALLQRLHDIRPVLEAEVNGELEAVVVQILDVQTLAGRHPRHVPYDDRQKHHAFVQHLVVRQIVQQRMRDAARRRGHEYRRAVHPRRRVAHQ